MSPDYRVGTAAHQIGLGEPPICCWDDTPFNWHQPENGNHAIYYSTQSLPPLTRKEGLALAVGILVMVASIATIFFTASNFKLVVAKCSAIGNGALNLLDATREPRLALEASHDLNWTARSRAALCKLVNLGSRSESARGTVLNYLLWLKHTLDLSTSDDFFKNSPAPCSNLCIVGIAIIDAVDRGRFYEKQLSNDTVIYDDHAADVIRSLHSESDFVLRLRGKEMKGLARNWLHKARGDQLRALLLQTLDRIEPGSATTAIEEELQSSWRIDALNDLAHNPGFGRDQFVPTLIRISREAGRKADYRLVEIATLALVHAATNSVNAEIRTTARDAVRFAAVSNRMRPRSQRFDRELRDLDPNSF